MKLAPTLSAILLAVSAGSAFAADLPSVKAPPPVYVAPPMWTGFYAGLNAGYGFGLSSNATTVGNAYDQYYTSYFNQPGWPPLLVAGYGGLMAANSGNASLNQNGFIGGGQIGYNYQWSPTIVIGVEADMQGSAIRGSGGYTGVGQDLYSMGRMMLMPHGTRNSVGGGTIQAGLDWFGTVRGRVGYLVTPTLLVFGTGGLTYGGAWANGNYTSTSAWCGTPTDACYGGMITTPYSQIAVGSGRTSSTLVGWNAGGGFEWMFMPNWSLKAEAFYYDLGSMNLNGSAVAAVSNVAAHMGRAVPDAQMIFPTTRVRYDGVIARAGINYHFNWGATPGLTTY